LQEIISRYPPRREYLLQILHELQESDPRHHLSPEAIGQVASYLGLSPVEVRDVATFYSMFSLSPRGRHLIRVCASPPCQLMGGTTVLRALEGILGIEPGETTPDGEFTLETTSCLGVCGVAPAMMIDGVVYGRLTEEKVERIIARIREGKP
jgi:NADH-quinone oxidoreductase E subunit